MVAADYKLKDRLGPAVPVEIAGWISSVYSSFDASSFVTQATSGLADLELMARARHVATMTATAVGAAATDVRALLRWKGQSSGTAKLAVFSFLRCPCWLPGSSRGATGPSVQCGNRGLV